MSDRLSRREGRHEFARKKTESAAGVIRGELYPMNTNKRIITVKGQSIKEIEPLWIIDQIPGGYLQTLV